MSPFDPSDDSSEFYKPSEFYKNVFFMGTVDPYSQLKCFFSMGHRHGDVFGSLNNNNKRPFKEKKQKQMSGVCAFFLVKKKPFFCLPIFFRQKHGKKKTTPFEVHSHRHLQSRGARGKDPKLVSQPA